MLQFESGDEIKIGKDIISRNFCGRHSRAFLAAFFLLAVLSCASGGVRYGSVTIDAADHVGKVVEALDYLNEKEPRIGALIGTHVRKISWNREPFWSLTYFPGHVTLSTASLRRGTPFLASLLYHELNHILIYKLRRAAEWPRDVQGIREHYRSYEGRRPEKIALLSRLEEERLVHVLQHAFLLKHGDDHNAGLVRLIIEDIEATYRHLPR